MYLPGESDRQAELNRMKYLATGLLVGTLMARGLDEDTAVDVIVRGMLGGGRDG